MSQVNVELGRASNATISLGESAVRTLFGVPSGAISMSQGYGKANEFSFTISSNQTNADLRTLAVNAGWNQSSKVVATIASGVYISSNSTGTPAITVSGSFPGGAELVNNGFIVGMGGAGGRGSVSNGVSTFYTSSENGSTPGTVGSAGGTALSASVALSVRNNGTIAGGGGGGGGGRGSWAAMYVSDDGWYTAIAGGGGGGGGRSSAAANSAGGPAAGTYGPAGNVGTVSAAGTGGNGSGVTNSYVTARGGIGGTGGGWGAVGSTGGQHRVAAGSASNATAGGSGGNAVSGNSNISWLATGTRLGGIT